MKKLLIKTERLQIRNFKPNDLDNFHFYRSNPEVTKFQGFDVMTMEEANDFIQLHQNKLYGQPGEWIHYAIEEVSTQKLAGDCAIKLDAYNPRIAEIGITISPVKQKNGFAREAFFGLLRFLFEEEQLHRIVETVDSENIASVNLMKSIGFRQEGHFIENFFSNGKWHSQFQYAMLKKEWDFWRSNQYQLKTELNHQN